jgi:hypothetical protein
MSRREIWGLRFFLAGLALGIGLMLFVVTFDGTSFYQNFVASTATEAMRPLGYVLDGGMLLAFILAVAGIACFSAVPSDATAPVADRAPAARVRAADHARRDARRRLRQSRPPASHGST